MNPPVPTLSAWPFLVTRGILLGYRVVIAPEFLVSAGDAGAVYASARTEPGLSTTGPITQVVKAANGEPLTLIHRRLPAAVDDLGAAPLRDRHGRPFPLIEGYALRGAHEDVLVTDEQWRELHRFVLSGYRRYLAGESQGPLLIPSREHSLNAPATPPVRPAPAPRPSPLPGFGITMVALVIVGAGVVAVLLVLLLR